MAIAAHPESFETLPEQGSSEFLRAQLYTHANGGIKFPIHDNEVHEVIDLEPEDHPLGVATRSFIEMSNGTRYEAIAGQPSAKGGDTAVVVMTPLGISVDHAHVKNTFEDLMELDFPTIVIGPPSGWSASSNPADAAHDIHQILDELLPALGIDDKQIFAHGGSRGAILGTGLCVPDIAGDRRVPYADLVSPCGPRPPKLIEVPEVLAYVPAVAAALGSSALAKALKGNFSDFKKLVSKDLSQPLNSARFFYQVASSGIAGKLAIASDPATHMHIGLFEKDRWSPADSWLLAFHGRENVTLDIEPGGHDRVAAAKTRQDVAARFAALREARGISGKELKHTDWLEIMQAHKTSDEIAQELGGFALDQAA